MPLPSASSTPGLRINDFQTLVFAGGGNRCWWQAGVVSRLLEEGWTLPPQLVGTSAGAALAASCLTGGLDAALAACKSLYGGNDRILQWRKLARGRLEFAHQAIYPAWLDAFFNPATFSALKVSSASLLVAVSRPSRLLGLRASVALGTLAYLADKKVWHRIHPKLPRYLGLRQDFVELSDCKDSEEAHRVLLAAAAAPPIMSAVKVLGSVAFDGGYTDNAPIPPQSQAQREKTLVLLTRRYPALPIFFRLNNRTYWQPSTPVPVSTWDCTARCTVDAAFELGRRDGASVLTAKMDPGAAREDVLQRVPA